MRKLVLAFAAEFNNIDVRFRYEDIEKYLPVTQLREHRQGWFSEYSLRHDVLGTFNLVTNKVILSEAGKMVIYVAHSMLLHDRIFNT